MSRLFVGFSGPVGYDYWRGGGRPNDPAPPNAVLEDVTGLLICYDELHFLSRDFCPRDMWELPYVNFVSEDSKLLERAVTASEQVTELLAEHGTLGWGDISGTFARTIAAMTGGDRGGIDNHSRRLVHTDGFNRYGNSADADSVAIDMGIASSLELQDLDVLTNTVSTEVVAQRVTEVDLSRSFSDWRVDVATELAAVKVPNVLGPEGGYHEDLELLRRHPKVEAFRTHLRGIADEAMDARDQAAELSELADELMYRSFQADFESEPIYRTIGRAGVGPAGNAIMLGLGTVASGGLKVLEAIQKKRQIADTAWASFVVSLKR